MLARTLVVVSSLLALGMRPAAVHEASAEPAPAWFAAYLASEMEHGGLFIADNSAYTSASETDDAYGIDWTWGIGKRSVRGRLFGLANGEETGTYWEMHTVWHPGANEARAYQFGGDGTFAEGTLRLLDEAAGIAGGIEILQTFTSPDGSTREVRHVSHPLAGGGNRGASFDKDGDGWKPRRSYDWLPEPRED